MAHWLTLFDVQSGLLIKHLASPLRTHDMAHVAQLHPELAADDVLVGDTAFASYAHLALLRQRNLQGVFRAHQRQLITSRRDRKLVGKLSAGTVATAATGRLVRKLGRYDQLVEYLKPPQVPTWMDAQTFRCGMPDKLVVRELLFTTHRKRTAHRDHHAGHHVVGLRGISSRRTGRALRPALANRNPSGSAQDDDGHGCARASRSVEGCSRS